MRALDCPIIHVSEPFTRLTGYPESEILGRNCRFLQAPDGYVTKGSRRKYTDNLAVKKMKDAFDARQEVQVTLTNYKKNGEVRLTPFMSFSCRI